MQLSSNTGLQWALFSHSGEKNPQGPLWGPQTLESYTLEGARLALCMGFCYIFFQNGAEIAES